MAFIEANQIIFFERWESDSKTSLVSSENTKCKLYSSKSSKVASQEDMHYISILTLKHLSKYSFLSGCWMEQKTKEQTKKHAVQILIFH